MTINILHVEDRKEEAEFIQMMLGRSPDFDVLVTQAESLATALSELTIANFDLVLLDLGLPDNVGVEAVEMIRDHSPSVPIFILSGDERQATALAAIQAGAQDYLPKQHMVGQVLARMTQLSIARQKRLRQAEEDSLTDGLTKLGNRRASDIAFEQRRIRLGNDHTMFGLVVVDIDRFKAINDLYGHDEGDQVIQRVAGQLSQASDEHWDLHRHGGEEFTVLFPVEDMKELSTIASRLQTSCSFSHGPQDLIKISVSCGVTAVHSDDSFRTAFKRADAALYASKGRGRCCSSVHDGQSIHPILIHTDFPSSIAIHVPCVKSNMPN